MNYNNITEYATTSHDLLTDTPIEDNESHYGYDHQEAYDAEQADHVYTDEGWIVDPMTGEILNRKPVKKDELHDFEFLEKKYKKASKKRRPKIKRTTCLNDNEYEIVRTLLDLSESVDGLRVTTLSQRELADLTGLPHQQVRTILKNLVNEGTIKIDSTVLNINTTDSSGLGYYGIPLYTTQKTKRGASRFVLNPINLSGKFKSELERRFITWPLLSCQSVIPISILRFQIPDVYP